MDKKNLGNIDRSIRGVIGVVMMAFVLFNGDILQEPMLEVLLGIFAVLNLISLVSGWCPVYHIANIRTCKVSRQE